MSTVLFINGKTLACTDENNRYCNILIEPEYLKNCMRDAILTLLESNSFTKPVNSLSIISLALKYYTKTDVFTPSLSYSNNLFMDKLLYILKNLPEYIQMLHIAKWTLILNNNELNIVLGIEEKCTNDYMSFEILIQEERLKSCMKDAIYALVEKGKRTTSANIIKLALLYYTNSSRVYIHNSDKLLNKFIYILKELPEFKIASDKDKRITIQIQNDTLVKRTLYPGFYNIAPEDTQILIDPIEIKLCMLDAMLSFIEKGEHTNAMNSCSVICLALGYYTGVYRYNVHNISKSLVWKKLVDIYLNLKPRKMLKNNTGIATGTMINQIYKETTPIYPNDILGYQTKVIK